MGRRAAELAGVLVASLITSFVTGLALAGSNEPVLYIVGAEIWVGDERKRAGERAKDRYR